MSERIRFYADEHVPRAVVEGLRRRGVDVLTVSDAELLGASDNEHLAFAFSRDACFLHRTWTFCGCTLRE